MRFARLARFTALAALFCSVPAAADTLVDNIQGVTIGTSGEVERFTGFVIDDDGRIAQVLERGDDRPRTDYLVDGEGRFVIPGLIDSHVHVMGIGLGAMTLDLSGTRSLAEAQAAIAAFSAENPDRPWILGRGWNQEIWGLGRFPTAAELDAVVSDRPVYLQRVDGHAGWANTLAIEAAGVTAKTVDPAGGRIERVPGSGAPAGVFVDAAEALVNAVIPAPRASDRDRALDLAQRKLAAFGITAVADMGSTIEDWQAFRRAGDGGRLNIRIIAYGAGIEQTELIGGSGPTPWLYDDRLRLNGVKLYLDGALGSRGAWLKRPYADDPDNRGLPLMAGAQLRNTLVRAALAGFQPAIHAIGDAANADALFAIDALSDKFDGDRRWRIEHAQVIDPADIVRFGSHGTIASFQPVHQTSDRLMAEARLDEARLEGAYAWKTVGQTGAPLVFGSDAPVESPDPFAGLATAFSRADADGQPFGGWRAHEAVSRETALAGFTANGAFAGFADGRFGRIATGEWADFVMLDRDPMLASPSELRAARVLQTWLAGRRVFTAGQKSQP
ncbi:MAG: amidohydrolase [Alteripontixanthobacter sp.]